ARAPARSTSGAARGSRTCRARPLRPAGTPSRSASGTSSSRPIWIANFSHVSWSLDARDAPVVEQLQDGDTVLLANSDAASADAFPVSGFLFLVHIFCCDTASKWR